MLSARPNAPSTSKWSRPPWPDSSSRSTRSRRASRPRSCKQRFDSTPNARRADGMADASARVAVVTGGTRGLGAAIVTRLAAEGTIVAAAYHEDDAAAEHFVAQHRSDGVVTTHRCDVGDPGSCRALIAEVVAKNGRVDYLVNNAGSLQ